MYTIAEYDNLDIPCYALPYLVNNDASGLPESDIKNIDNYMAQYYNEAKEKNARVIFSVVGDEYYFSRSPEFGLACDCEKCTILIVK